MSIKALWTESITSLWRVYSANVSLHDKNAKAPHVATGANWNLRENKLHVVGTFISRPNPSS